MYVERANLTLRELIAPLSRRTWSIAYDVQHLRLHIQWGLAYYHLVQPHKSLQVRVRGPNCYRYRTPAITACRGRPDWAPLDRGTNLDLTCTGKNLARSLSDCLSLPTTE